MNLLTIGINILFEEDTNILIFSGILKGKQDALKFEREIRNEWER
jgi:hypothetical protein